MNDTTTAKIVCVVEDDPAIQEILELKLTHEHFKVHAVGNGTEALPMLREHHPDALILDLMLPGMSGEEILEQMKADPDLKDIPVIIFTNRSDGSDIQKLKAMGADEYLIKANTIPGDVVRTVQELIHA